MYHDTEIQVTVCEISQNLVSQGRKPRLDEARVTRLSSLIDPLIAAVMFFLPTAIKCVADSAEIVLQSYLRTPVISVCWNVDGILAEAYDSGDIRLWDGKTHTTPAQMRLLRTIPADATDVTWSPDGKTLASGSADNTVNPVEIRHALVPNYEPSPISERYSDFPSLMDR